MSYGTFHLVLIVPPLVALAWLQRGRLETVHSRAGRYLALIAAIAFVYTTPWDNYLVRRGVWGYGTDRVVGTIGYVPVEEYLFFLLQPLLTGLWLYLLLPIASVPQTGAVSRTAGRGVRLLGTMVYVTAAVSGALVVRRPEGTYLGLILVWAAPVLAFQWVYAGSRIWEWRRAWGLGVAVPTLYLCGADAIAIADGIWTIAPAYTLGASIGPLPIEEAIFFLVTNLLVVQGLILFLHPPVAAPDRQNAIPATMR